MIDILTNYSRKDLKGLGWEKENLIADALNGKDDSLSSQDYGTILSAIRVNQPLVIKRKQVIDYRVFISTDTVMVEYFQYQSNNGSYVRCSMWGGFGWNQYLMDIVSIATPDHSLEPTDEYV